MHRAFLFLFCLLMCVTHLCSANEKTDGLTLIKTIGDDRDDYTLFGIADAVITDKNEIFIVNAKANYISQYNWDGKFKGKFGQRGQGPQDFFFPGGIDFYANKIYIMDTGNKRVAVMDTETKQFQYIKQNPSSWIGGKFIVINENLLLGFFKMVEGQRGRIAIVDKNWEIKKTFFHEFPIKLENTSVENSDNLSTEKLVRQVLLGNYSLPVIGADSKRERFLVTFGTPDNPIIFFVYDNQGNLIKEFKYNLEDKKYKFWDFMYNAPIETMQNPKKWPRRFEIFINSTAVAGDHYIAFLSLEERMEKKEILDRKRVCLIFDKDGNLKKKFQLKEKAWRIFKYSNGYFLGTLEDAETEQLLIFKIPSI